MAQYSDNSRRGEAREPVCLADCLRPQPHHHIARLGGKTADRAIIEIGWNGNGLVTMQRLDIGTLTLEISSITAIRLKLLAKGMVNRLQFGPETGQACLLYTSPSPRD